MRAYCLSSVFCYSRISSKQLKFQVICQLTSALTRELSRILTSGLNLELIFGLSQGFTWGVTPLLAFRGFQTDGF